MTSLLEIKTLIDKRLSLRNAVGFLMLFYAVGTIGLGYDGSRNLFIWLMPFSLLLSLALVLYFHTPWKNRHIWVFIMIALAGYLLEVLGVFSGEVFGHYQYHHALGLKVLQTPLMIGINWLLLTYCVYVIVKEHLRLSPLPAILGGAALMVLYDFVMEPVAIRLYMWSWGGPEIPVQNYIAWFIFSLLFLGLLHLFKVKFQNKLAPWLFGIQFLFFLLLNIMFRFL